MVRLSEADPTVQCGLHHCSSEAGRVPFGSGWRQEEVEGLRPVVDSLEMWIVPARFQDTVSTGHWQLAVWQRVECLSQDPMLDLEGSTGR